MITLHCSYCLEKSSFLRLRRDLQKVVLKPSPLQYCQGVHGKVVMELNYLKVWTLLFAKNKQSKYLCVGNKRYKLGYKGRSHIYLLSHDKVELQQANCTRHTSSREALMPEIDKLPCPNISSKGQWGHYVYMYMVF